MRQNSRESKRKRKCERRKPPQTHSNECTKEKNRMSNPTDIKVQIKREREMVWNNKSRKATGMQKMARWVDTCAFSLKLCISRLKLYHW